MSKEVDILTHAAENRFNALLVGRHGVGKTAIVREVFDKMGWNWKYFSASTIDPWVDLVGVPKEKDGVLELIRPANLDFDNVEAFFFDEYNRAPKKVRNAVMEVIQFGSINGKKFPKLKVVFAAINPDDDEDMTYDVEKLDPAQKDRFHIHLEMSNSPCPFFFANTYGHHGKLAVGWWKNLNEKLQDLVSPRRLEAAVRVFLAGGDTQYVLDPQKINSAEFAEALNRRDPIEVLDELMTLTEEKQKEVLLDPNQYRHIERDLLGKQRYLKKFVHLIPEAELMKQLRDGRGNKVIGYVAENAEKFKHLADPVLNNYSAYSARVVKAFRTLKDMAPTPGGDNHVVIKGQPHEFSSLTFSFAGKLKSMSRSEAENNVTMYGGSVSAGVTFQTTHLVVADDLDDDSPKNRADQMNVEVLTENDFYRLVSNLEKSEKVAQQS